MRASWEATLSGDATFPNREHGSHMSDLLFGLFLWQVGEHESNGVPAKQFSLKLQREVPEMRGVLI
jgi:hypothetical protein